MTRLLTCTAVALFLGLTPALAADNNTTADNSSGAAQQSSAPAGSKAAMDNTAKKPGAGIIPSEGSMDTSSGAAQQSSAPPASAAATGSMQSGDALTANEPGDKQGMNDTQGTKMGGQMSGNAVGGTGVTTSAQGEGSQNKN